MNKRQHEWQVEHSVLLPGFDVPVAQLRPQRHAHMLRLYGQCEGYLCRDCAHLVRKIGGYRGYFFKRELFGITSSAATDWRLSWQACGRFEEREA